MVSNAGSIWNEFVHEPLRQRVSPPSAVEEFLFTCPHAAVDKDIKNYLRDPHAFEIVDLLNKKMKRRGINATCVVPTVHRSQHDQNRLEGLYMASDCVVDLHKFQGRSKNFMNLDVHSYFLGDQFPLPRGWGRGINIIILNRDIYQRALAESLKTYLDDRITTNGSFATVVEMEAYPLHWKDGNSNAIMEWARSIERMSLLIEIPCIRNEKSLCADDDCWTPLLCPQQLSDILGSFLEVNCCKTIGLLQNSW